MKRVKAPFQNAMNNAAEVNQAENAIDKPTSVDVDESIESESEPEEVAQTTTTSNNEGAIIIIAGTPLSDFSDVEIDVSISFTQFNDIVTGDKFLNISWGEVSPVSNEYPGFQLIAQDNAGSETVIFESTTLSGNESNIPQKVAVEHLRSEFLLDSVILVTAIITTLIIIRAYSLSMIQSLTLLPDLMISQRFHQQVNL